MRKLTPSWTDERVEILLGRLLRTGVLLSAAVVLAGAAVYLARFGSTRPDYSLFRGEPPALLSPAAIVHGIFHGSGRDWMELGLLLLIATPVARVAFSIFAFLLEGDLLYVSITALVLAILLYSLLAGA